MVIVGGCFICMCSKRGLKIVDLKRQMDENESIYLSSKSGVSMRFSFNQTRICRERERNSLVCYGKTHPRRFFNFLSQNSLIKSMQIPNNPLRSSQYSNTHSPKHLPNLRMSWCNHNLERNRRPSRKPIILFQIDRLPGQLGHIKSPEHTRNGQPDLALGNDHAWADSTTREKN
jgi:hypothetical protein